MVVVTKRTISHNFRSPKSFIHSFFLKIIGWTPIPFYNASDEGQDIYNEKRDVSKAPTLDAWIKQQNIKYNPYAWVYVSCYGIVSRKNYFFHYFRSARNVRLLELGLTWL